MANLEAALAYLRAHGDPQTLLRLGAMLGVRLSPSELEGFTAGQLLGGGWPAAWSGGQASLLATCERLQVLESLGALRGLEAVRALGYIAASQSDDGSWSEPSSIFRDDLSSIRRDHPDGPDSRPWVTAHCAFWLALGGVHPERVNAALGWLRGLEHPGLRVSWLTAGLLYRRGGVIEANTLLNRLREYLGFDTPATELSRLLIGLQAAGVPVSHPSLVRARSLLGAAQRGDGRWAGQDNPDHDEPDDVADRDVTIRDIETTFEAYRALRLTERVLPGLEPLVARADTVGPARPALAAVVIGLRDLVSGLHFWRRLLAREPTERSADEATFDLDGLRLVLRQDAAARQDAAISLMFEVPADAFDAMLERARSLGAETLRSRFQDGRLRGVIFHDPQGVQFELCQTGFLPRW